MLNIKCVIAILISSNKSKTMLNRCTYPLRRRNCRSAQEHSPHFHTFTGATPPRARAAATMRPNDVAKSIIQHTCQHTCNSHANTN